MSIITLKRRAESTVGPSTGPDGRFTLQGNHRNPASVIGDGRRVPFQSHMEIPCTPEDSALFKRSVMSNAGMLATRFRQTQDSIVARMPVTTLTHADYLAHVVNARLAPCPDPAVKPTAPACAFGDVPGACLGLRTTVERASAHHTVPDMPGKTGAQDYATWLRQKTACAYADDEFSRARGWGAQCR